MSSSSHLGCGPGNIGSLRDSRSSHYSPPVGNDSIPGFSPPRKFGGLLLGLGSVMSLWFGHNDIFSAGFGLIFLNIIWGVVKDGAIWLWNSLTSRVTYSVTVRSKDEAYTWLLEWFAAQPYMTRAHCMTLKTVNKGEPGDNGDSDTSDRPKIFCFPSVGQHFIDYKGKYVTFNRSEDKSALSDGGGLSISRGEQLTITLYHYDKSILTDLIHEAMELSYSKLTDKTTIYIADQWGGWDGSTKKAKRDLSSVVLDENVASALEKDLNFFISNKEWYRTRGVPHRRGYLLHGPPGTGKTSFILAMAGKLGYNLCTLNINSEGLDDNKLHALLQGMPRKSFVVLEDVDGVFNKRQKEGGGKVTFSGLLNVLDGIASTDGRILFMTTNHVDRLSPALIRPGRIDRKFLFDFASHAQISAMFEQFFGKDTFAEVLAVILDQVADRTITTAQLQGWFILYCSEPEKLADTINEFIAEALADNSRTDEIDEKEEEDGKDKKEEPEKEDKKEEKDKNEDKKKAD
eukprot:Phypoly_transcript_04853.p1 GENE.Phypoly_transcript_04853~~Phypoly_transcript_04853.p1  ORF type:complete len:516 (+),score=87.27 Phypoly_transcript_04853:191-1738(+)